MNRYTVLLLIGIIGLSGAVAAAPDATAPAINRSDVVFMGPKSDDDYKLYGGTVVSWGGRPGKDNAKDIDAFRQRIAAAKALGIRYCGGAAFRTAFAGMIDFDPNFMDAVCHDLDGKPIMVPWLWDHKYKGNPAYWFCTNSPDYRRYLMEQVRLIATADVDGLHIDDYNGTAGTEGQGACFCRSCMAAFREYLKANVSPQRLKECGVTSRKSCHSSPELARGRNGIQSSRGF